MAFSGMINLKSGLLTLGGQFDAYKRGQLERNIQIHATDDGNLFFNKHHAQEHARRTKSELTTISREVSAEDKAPKETTAEASNTSAEITPSDALEANGKVTLKVAKDFGAGKENKRGKTKNNG